MEDCIFCKIIKGELPCHKIYEDEDNLAFLTIKPFAKGHTLVIPKKHFENVFEMPEKEISSLARAVKKTAAIIKKATGCGGVNILNASGKSAQQSVFHIHFHIVPRFDRDGLDIWPEANVDYDMEKFAEKARAQG